MAAPATRALRFAQCRTLLLLFLGYASCYFCRSNLSVATPLLLDELGRRGISHADAMVAIGSMASWGVLAYALGKWFLTGLGDYWGGKRNLFGRGLAARQIERRGARLDRFVPGPLAIPKFAQRVGRQARQFAGFGACRAIGLGHRNILYASLERQL